jgi:hypothetical protein
MTVVGLKLLFTDAFTSDLEVVWLLHLEFAHGEGEFGGAENLREGGLKT